MPSRIAIIGAMDCEINSIKNLLENLKEKSYKNFTIYTSTLYGKDVILAKSGVGKVNAAVNCQYIIDKYSPELIINTGVAGGLSKNLKIGDIVIGESLVQHDFDATALGYAKGYMCNGINPDKPTTFRTDKALVKKAEEILRENIKKSQIHKGIIATGDMFIGTSEKKKEINQTFNAIAAEMEGCAIIQTANINEISCIVIRAISDLADGTATKSQNEFEEMTSKISTETVKILLKNL